MVIVAGHVTVDPERRESHAALTTFRRRGPRSRRATALLSISVAEYDIADVRHLSGDKR
jgi:hypothetical protein